MLEECTPQEDSLPHHPHKRAHPSPASSTSSSTSPTPTSNSCKSGGECEQIEVKHHKLHIYNYFQRVPAFINAYVNYPRNTWITTRDLARKLDQIDQFTHHHLHESSATVASHLCMVVRPTGNHVQKNFFSPTKRSPLHAAQGKPIFELLKTLDRRTEIVVYCTVGYRSGWMARALQAQGFTAVCLYGGIKKWADEGREIFVFKSDKRTKEHSGLKDKIQRLKELRESKRMKRTPLEEEHSEPTLSIQEANEIHEVEEFNAQGMLRKHESMEELVKPGQLTSWRNLSSSQQSL